MNYSVSTDALKEKVILVTGAGDGIGKQAAISFAAHGATVILLGRTVKKLEQTYDAIEAAGYPTPAIVPLDMKGATKQNYLDMVDTIEINLAVWMAYYTMPACLAYSAPSIKLAKTASMK